MILTIQFVSHDVEVCFLNLYFLHGFVIPELLWIWLYHALCSEFNYIFYFFDWQFFIHCTYLLLRLTWLCHLLSLFGRIYQCLSPFFIVDDVQVDFCRSYEPPSTIWLIFFVFVISIKEIGHSFCLSPKLFP